MIIIIWILLYEAVGQNTWHNNMRLGIQSVGTRLADRRESNVATGTFDVGGVQMSY